MPLLKRALPFDDPGWIFELKYDGFRSLAVMEHGRCQLVSRNGNPFGSFADLAVDIATAVRNTNLTVIDGEIVCVEPGKTAVQRSALPPWRSLLFRVFDVLVTIKSRLHSQPPEPAVTWRVLGKPDTMPYRENRRQRRRPQRVALATAGANAPGTARSACGRSARRKGVGVAKLPRPRRDLLLPNHFS
jgi:ATP dependent DNA ligase domain